MGIETQIKEALARGYCAPENSHKELDPMLIETMTKELLSEFTQNGWDCYYCKEKFDTTEEWAKHHAEGCKQP